MKLKIKKKNYQNLPVSAVNNGSANLNTAKFNPKLENGKVCSGNCVRSQMFVHTRNK